MDISIDMQRDFSRYPAGRYKTDGPYSGEKFRDELLLPQLQKSKKVTVDLDSGLAYGSSFLEEAFGGLVRAGLSVQFIREHLKLLSRDQVLVEEIYYYIEEAAKDV